MGERARGRCRGTALRLAVFSSEGCPLCAQVAPAVAARRRRPAAGGARVRRARRRGGLARGGRAGQPVCDRAERRRSGAGEGDVQQPRPAGERARDGALSRAGAVGCRLSARGARARAARSPSVQPVPAAAGEGEHFADAVLRHSSRRGFLEWAGAAIIALAGGRALARGLLPDEAEASFTNFCGHTLHDGQLPASDGPAARRPPRPAAARLRRSSGRRPGTPDRRAGLSGGRARADRCANPAASRWRRRRARASARRPAGSTGWSSAPTARGIAAAAGACAG